MTFLLLLGQAGDQPIITDRIPTKPEIEHTPNNSIFQSLFSKYLINFYRQALSSGITQAICHLDGEVIGTAGSLLAAENTRGRIQ